MRLWLLRPIDPDSGPWDPWYDKAFGFVVRAESEQLAREAVATRGWGAAGDEGRAPWLDASLSSCEPLDGDGPAEIIMRDFAGA